METKRALSSGLKELDESGSLLVEFARPDGKTIDLDGDITMPGAFGEQDVRIQPHGHDTRALMIGKGRIYEQDGRALLEGRLFVKENPEAQITWAVLKADLEHPPPRQEWSYTFDILDSDLTEVEGRGVRVLKRLQVHSVDPVFLGAGIGTRTLAVKAADKIEMKAALRPHRTGVAPMGEEWSRPTLSDFTSRDWADLDRDERLRISEHAVWSDSGFPAERFSDLGGFHHRPQRTGIGPAVWRAVSSSRMMQAAWSENPGVRRHLESHYEEFGRTPPWRRSLAELEAEAQRAARLLSALSAARARPAELRELSEALTRLSVEIDFIEDVLAASKAQQVPEVYLNALELLARLGQKEVSA